jgi:anti-sigma factor RsiW
MTQHNHQPFEDWLLSDERLTTQDALALQEHLKSCPACTTLGDALHAVEGELRRAAHLAPAPGFVSRWQVRLAEGRLKKHRRQTLLSMVLSIGGAMALLVILLVVISPLLRNPVPVLLASAYQLITTVGVVRTLGEAVLTVLRMLVGLVPPTQGAAILLALACLGLVWIFAMRRLTITIRRVIE